MTEISKKYKPDESYLKNINPKDLEKSAYDESVTLNWAVFMYISRDWTVERKKEREINYIPIINMVQKYVIIFITLFFVIICLIIVKRINFVFSL